MSKKNLFEFQDEAVKKVINLLSTKETIRLQSPTGSGKTFITANIVEKIIKSEFSLKNNEITFLYIAPSTGQLDYQGYSKIREYLDEGSVKGFSTEYIGTKDNKSQSNNYLSNIDYLKNNKVYFIGWGLLRSKTRIMNENEKGNLFDVIINTHLKNTKIVLIIDESHREYLAKSKDDQKLRNSFLNELNPILKIEMSATLNKKADVKIKVNDVKLAGVIKQEIKVNNIDTNWDEDDKNIQLIKNALDKRDEIQESIRKTKLKNMNPLILIQIPDGNPNINEKSINSYYESIIEKTLNSIGMKEGFDFVYWLDKRKTIKNKDSITKNQSPYKVLIFKQAIATGWDIPRACILIKFRNPKNSSKSFEIQTLGRILRNPFLKIFTKNKKFSDIDIDNLNNAFVFTNDNKIYGKEVKDSEFGSFIEKQFLEYPLSKIGKTIPLKINKIRINNFSTLTIESIVNELFNHSDVFHKIVKEINSHKSNIDVLSSSVIDSISILKNKLEETSVDDKMNLAKSEYSLFYRHVVLMQQIKYNRIIIIMIDKMVSKFNISKKKIYDYFIAKYSQSFVPNKTLAEFISEEIEKILSKKIEYYKNGNFILNNNIKYPDEYTDTLTEKKNVNSYDFQFTNYDKAFESNIEKDFYLTYKKRFSNEKNMHIYRNKKNPNDSFFIEYFSITEDRINKFYPDFIITTEQNIYVVECKGFGNFNVDINDDKKIKALYVNKENLINNKKVNIVKVGRHSDESKLEAIVYEKNINANFTIMSNDEFLEKIN